MDSPSDSAGIHHADPLDYLAGLALADVYEESGDQALSHLQRGRAWLLAWASQAPGKLTKIAGNRGSGFKLAYFSVQPTLPPAARKRGKRIPHQPPSTAIVFKVNNYTVIRGTGFPELIPPHWESLLPVVKHGATVAELIRAVEMDKGVWFPMEV